MSLKQNILIVEDEQSIARFLSLELEFEGYAVKCVFNGRDGLEEALAKDYSLIILDVMLPDLNGIEVLRRLRQAKQTPVIILTARDTIVDKVSGLDIGANDYMTKPFAIEELLARIRNTLKLTVANDLKSEIKVGDLVLESTSRKVTYKGNAIDLTKKEFDLLLYLLNHRNVVLAREKILDAVWGFEYFGNTNVVDVYIRYLRSKIDEVYNIPLIETVRGMGYTIR